ESRPGFVVHTASSATLVRTPLIGDWIGHNLEEVGSANVKLADALRLYGDSEEPGETAFSIAFGLPKEKSFWEFLATDGEGDKRGWRMQRFAKAMQFISSGSSYGVERIHGGFDWKSLEEATIVDVRHHCHHAR